VPKGQVDERGPKPGPLDIVQSKTEARRSTQEEHSTLKWLHLLLAFLFLVSLIMAELAFGYILSSWPLANHQSAQATFNCKTQIVNPKRQT